MAESLNQDVPKRNKIKFPHIPILSLVILCIIGVALFFFTEDLRAYHDAKKIMNSGNYQTASKRFKGLNNYKNSVTLYEECLFNIAHQEFEAKQYLDVIDTLAKLPNYADTNKLYKKAMFSIAQEQFDAEQYLDAMNTLDKIPDYNYTNDLLSKVNYQYASILMADKDYQNAVQYLKDLDIEDSKEMYEKASALSNSLAYKGKLYITPEELIKIISDNLVSQGITWKIAKPASDSNNSNQLSSLIIDSSGNPTSSILIFYGCNEDEGTLDYAALGYDSTEAGSENLYIALSLYLACDSTLDFISAKHIMTSLLGKVQSAISLGTEYENNNLKYSFMGTNEILIFMIEAMK